MGNRRKGDPGLLRLHRAAGGGGGSLKTERSLELSTRIRKRRHWSLPVFGMNALPTFPTVGAVFMDVALRE